MYSVSVKDDQGNIVSIDARDVEWIYEIKSETDDKATGHAHIILKDNTILTVPMSQEDLQAMEAGFKAANNDIRFGAFQGERLPLQNLPNTRSLGGLPAGKEVIRMDRLIRSGELHKATPMDKDYLVDKMQLKTVIDLRTELERLAAPDPHIPGVLNLHLPLLHTGTYEKIGLRLATMGGFEEMLEHAPQMMQDLYVDMVTGETGIENLKKIFQVFLDQESGSVLWHCTQGKDRTGVVAALLEYALGMSEEAILNDYLQTNVYLASEKEHMAKELETFTHMSVPEIDNLDFLYQAKPSFLQAARDAILKKYPSIDAYLEMLGIGEAEKASLRQLYLI